MGLFDDALKNAVPDGNLTKPLIIAAGALILGKMLSGRSAPQEAQPAPQPVPQAPPPGAAPAGDDGGLLGGLGGLLGKLQQGGLADAANSWVGTGQNQPVQPGQLGQALGQSTISDLAKQAGISEQDLLNGLSQVLPGLIDKLTPNGRVPTHSELGSF
ncbi:YidB family protein [Labrys wisconsinensis]|uniref:Uncharacterized protein YidB (DUF937 family) n=1 Tax=Labrys wisconsinensis TaxID=425677 RepID=A0ABU0JB44_9HYPH|nr:YidB family protein [Labrys wisconsinensis]MDQ0471491.1 uncharacterized protein YidB (DUF937 family) [Labrys wisconsinensis]